MLPYSQSHEVVGTGKRPANIVALGTRATHFRSRRDHARDAARAVAVPGTSRHGPDARASNSSPQTRSRALSSNNEARRPPRDRHRLTCNGSALSRFTATRCLLGYCSTLQDCPVRYGAPWRTLLTSQTLCTKNDCRRGRSSHHPSTPGGSHRRGTSLPPTEGPVTPRSRGFVASRPSPAPHPAPALR